MLGWSRYLGVQVSVIIPCIDSILNVVAKNFLRQTFFGYVYHRFEPESRQPNGSKEEGRKKTVTFAGSPMVASPSADSLGSALR